MSLFLALIMLFQIILPQNIFAGGDNSLPQGKYATVGKIDYKAFDTKTMIEMNKVAARNRKTKSQGKGVSLYSPGPYFDDDNEPTDENKPKYHGNVKAKLTVKGLNDGEFQWNEIFGVDEEGNPKPAQIVFTQINDETGVETGVERYLKITEAGVYTWTDGDGNPAELPLFNNKFEPFFYEVRIDEDVAEKVQLLTANIFGSEDARPTFEEPDAEGRIKFNLTLDLTLRQVTSTKFTSQWVTGLDEANRPQIQVDAKFSGVYMGQLKTKNLTIDLPRNDTGKVIVRDLDDQGDPKLVIAERLYNKPQIEIKKDTPGLTFEENNGVKTVKSGNHKFKYDFTYDVINGGKLTMTEILPVTFDANGGKFASITDENAEQKIVKEVEYDKDLTDKVEEPKKALETFKGWATTKDGTPLTEEKFKEAVKNVKEAKTFYAIWDNNDILADQLEVKESFKDGTGYVNDFIPTLETLKEQVKIKDGNGDPQALANDDTFEILDDSGTAITGDALKDYLYGKLQEKANHNDEPTRVETVKAKVTHANGTSQEVDIPIKVVKNIYEAKTLTEKPFYVPDGYVKVTVDPTTKAQDPQKTYYYVNKEAKVIIPGEDPKGAGDNKFVKWTYNDNGTETEYKLADKPRHQFKSETIITAQYVSDVIPQEGTNKPDTVPSNFVEVKFVPTEKATDETKAEKIYWVNPEKAVTIPVKDPVGKTYYTFKEWKIGVNADGDVYTPSTAKKFTEATTITATYTESENIIPYDPSATDPMVRPDGYVRVSFAADTGLKLTEQKAYYVKKNANITLKTIKDDATKGYPTYEELTGYKFDKWDKEDSLVIEAADIVVTAKATSLDEVVPKTKQDETEKPAGYVTVKFVAGENGKLKDGENVITDKTFFVNPEKYVKLVPPTELAKGNTGFEFGAWDKDATIPTVYKDAVTTITAKFNQINAVIPKVDENTNKPEGYVEVTFVIDQVEGKDPATFVEGQVETYFVDPNRNVIIQPPTTKANTGYEFVKWDKETTAGTRYSEDTKVHGTFKKLDDIIPSTDDKGKQNPKPEGYVTVTFEKGDHGKSIEGQTVYYVNPKADPAKTLGDPTIVKPEVKAETGYKFTGWDIKDDFEIKDNKTVIAQYEEIADVIPKTKEDDSEKPEGYITVTFVKGDHGKELTGQAVYYVNPNKAVVLKDKAPTAVPNTGYIFARWDVTIDKAIQYKDGDKITALYNDPGNISKTEVAGYVKVEFKPGTNGSLTGTTMYWVKPGVEVNVPDPTVTPNVGYKFDKWDKDLTVNLQPSDSPYEITAGYTSLDDIIPQKNTNGSDKPDGYFTVTFKAVNGTLSGQNVFYVNGEKAVDLTNTANAITKNPNVGYTADGGTWSPEITSKKYTGNAEYTFTFKPLDDVIEKTKEDESEKPAGYVKVTLIPTDKATDTTEKIYFVNPTKEVTIENTPVGTEFTDANGITYKYTFTGWTVTSGTINSWNSGTIKSQFIQDTKITAKYSTKVDYGKLVPAPVPKKDLVTSKGDTPKPEDLIKNVPGSENDPLPDGTKINYTNDGTPDVSNPGKTTAKVEVKYPNGKTVVVEVPITVVDNVVPQTGNDKPIVPESYVKVTVDTTDAATANTKFTKVFWVKPNVEVTIPDILAPTGKAETDANGVTKTNNFKKWKLVGSDPEKFYENGITDTFTAKESTIVATYEFDKNVEPVGKNDQWIPQGSKPSAKDFINNPYDDSDPKNPKNLPPGTKLEFVPGTEPNTNEQGTNMTTTIKVTYPNGEVKEVPVTYNVTGDVVEQKDPDKKPDVPSKFVEVIVKTTDMATEDVTRTFWVNPDKVVNIPVKNPTGKEVTKPDGTIEYTWKFTGWDNNLTQQFKDAVTTITAQYKKDFGELTPVEPIPEAKGGFIYTDLGKKITEDQYKKEITLPDGYSFETGTTLEMIKETAPDINKNGRYYVSFWVTYPDGKAQKVEVLVYVGEARPEPKPPTPDEPGEPGYPSYPGRPYIPMYPEVRYKTIIQEKIVKVPMPISDDNYFKEVRYMQGFNGYFRPNEGLTRAEAAQILANALVEDGYKYNPNFKISYKDVGEAWYTRAVKIVTEANVFAGYDDGNFKPQGKITRNEWIATLKRFQELDDASGNNMKLSDNHWAKAEIQAAFNEGWLKIYTDGLATYKGDEFIPRQEVAAVSNKAFKRIVDKTYIGKNNLSLVSYKDVKTSMWAYEDILCASNTFLDKKDLYRAHWVKEDKNQFNIDTSDFKIVQKNFQRNPR